MAKPVAVALKPGEKDASKETPFACAQSGHVRTHRKRGRAFSTSLR